MKCGNCLQYFPFDKNPDCGDLVGKGDDYVFLCSTCLPVYRHEYEKKKRQPCAKYRIYKALTLHHGVSLTYRELRGLFTVNRRKLTVSPKKG